MDYLSTVYSGLHKFLMLNTATLSGAVDIIVIQHPVPLSNTHSVSDDVEMGELSEEHGKKESSYFTSTPFHIRFGKLKLLNSSEHVVQIKINNKPVELKMKLGPEGVAYFDQPGEEDLIRENMDSAHLSSPPVDLVEKYRVHSRALSDGVLIRSSSGTDGGSQCKPSSANATNSAEVFTATQEAAAAIEETSQMKGRNAVRSLSASTSPAKAPLSMRSPADSLGDVIWWWGNPEPRRADISAPQLCRVESVLGTWARKDLMDLESKIQIENLTKEIEDLDTALTLSGMELQANTTKNGVNNDEKPEDVQGSSWGFLSWFKSKNPKKEMEDPTASVKELLELEGLEKLKRKGELLRAAQRRESERNLQNVVNSKSTEEVEEGVNKEEQMEIMKSSWDDLLSKPVDENQILPASSSHMVMSSPSKASLSKELLLGRHIPEDFYLDERRSTTLDAQTVNENNTESLLGSVEEMSTVTFEDKECLTATDIEDFNSNDLAKELQPGVWGKVKISLCGHRLGRSMVHNKNVFQSHLVTWETLCQNPSLVFDDRMVIMTNQRLYPGRVALPLILSTLAFEKPLSGETLAILAMNDPLQKLFSENVEQKGEEEAEEKIEEEYPEEKVENGDGTLHKFEKSKSLVLSPEESGKKLASSPNPNVGQQENAYMSIPSTQENPSEEKPVITEANTANLANTKSEKSSSVSNNHNDAAQQNKENNCDDIDLPNTVEDESYSWLSTFWSKGNQKRKGRKRKRNIPVDSGAATIREDKAKTSIAGTMDKKSQRRTKKTLKPTSAMLHCLELNPGENQIEFVVNSKLQGQQSVKASIWLWRSDDKIVVSDVDGTITKSDVMGHCMPWVGNSWCHDGVASYFSDIENNGYRIMYLTSRSIGHAAITREYLFNEVGQNGQLGNLEFLPGGPVIMAPDSLFTAVNRELIQRNPQQFKIPALQNVKDLFPEGYQPYAAAFGNRKTDLIAYNSVDIPIDRIFIIDKTGAMRTANRDYNVTYPILDTIVDVMFPPSKCLPSYAECNDLVHWKQEYIADLDDLSSLSDCEDH